MLTVRDNRFEGDPVRLPGRLIATIYAIRGINTSTFQTETMERNVASPLLIETERCCWRCSYQPPKSDEVPFAVNFYKACTSTKRKTNQGLQLVRICTAKKAHGTLVGIWQKPGQHNTTSPEFHLRPLTFDLQCQQIYQWRKARGLLIT